MDGRVIRRIVLPALLGAVVMGGTACESDSGGGSGDIGDNNPDVYVALGDSLTSGREAPAGAPYPDRLAGMVGKTVVNAGSGGARSASGVGSVNGLLQKYQPARLLVLYGANDIGAGVSVGEFEGNIRAIVGAAKANQTIPVLGTIPPEYDSHAFAMPAIQSFNAAIRRIGSSEGVPVANTYGAFGSDRSYVQADGLHPTDAGNNALARTFANKVP